MVTEQEPPKIEFPCDYPIKVLGEADSRFHEHVLLVMDKYAPGLTKCSRQGVKKHIIKKGL